MADLKIAKRDMPIRAFKKKLKTGGYVTEIQNKGETEIVPCEGEIEERKSLLFKPEPPDTIKIKNRNETI